MRSSLSVGLSAIAFTIAASASAQTRPDLNSFVNRKVADTPSLVNQVRNDSTVADRYERHFAMNRRELVAYLGTLHKGTLAKEGVYTVYSVPKGGWVKMHSERLKKGTPMFLDRAGHPTLIVKCGNPVVLGPARARKANPVVATPTEDSGSRAMALVPRDSEVENPADILALEPAIPTATEPPIVETPPPTLVAEPPVNTVPVSGVGVASRWPWLAAAPILVALGGGINHGGGGGGEITPVPEPTTMVMLGLGVAAMARRRKA